MGQGPDQEDCQGDADRREEADRQQAASQLRKVESQGGLEHKPGHESQKDHVRADVRQLLAGKQPDNHAGRREHDRVRQHPRPPRDKTQHGGQRADQDEQQQEALLGCHSTRSRGPCHPAPL